MGKLEKATRSGTRLQQLEALAALLARQLDAADGDADGKVSVAQLARQYRETTQEIEQLRAGDDEGALDDVL